VQDASAYAVMHCGGVPCIFLIVELAPQAGTGSNRTWVED